MPLLIRLISPLVIWVKKHGALFSPFFTEVLEADLSQTSVASPSTLQSWPRISHMSGLAVVPLAKRHG